MRYLDRHLPRPFLASFLAFLAADSSWRVAVLDVCTTKDLLLDFLQDKAGMELDCFILVVISLPEQSDEPSGRQPPREVLFPERQDGIVANFPIWVAQDLGKERVSLRPVDP
jgi:hypothetical protein